MIEALLWLRAITSLVVTSINNLFHQGPMTCLCWTRHKLAHCAGCRIGLGGGKYDWSEGAGGLLPALCYYPYGQGGAHSWPRRRHLVTQDPSPCWQEGPSLPHSSGVLANYGQFCREYVCRHLADIGGYESAWVLSYIDNVPIIINSGEILTHPNGRRHKLSELVRLRRCLMAPCGQPSTPPSSTNC